MYKGGTSPTLVPAVLEGIRMPLSVCGSALGNQVLLFCTGAGANNGLPLPPGLVAKKVPREETMKGWP